MTKIVVHVPGNIYSKSSGIDKIIVESSYEARIEVELGTLEAI